MFRMPPSSAEDKRSGYDIILPDSRAETVTITAVVSVGLRAQVVVPK